MANEMLQGLAIAGIGIGLVFLMILALWGIIALLVLLTTRTEPPELEVAEEQPAAPPDAEHKAEAAAAAVAFALAREHSQRETAEGSGATHPSQWLVTGRLQQLNQGMRGRRG